MCGMARDGGAAEIGARRASMRKLAPADDTPGSCGGDDCLDALLARADARPGHAAGTRCRHRSGPARAASGRRRSCATRASSLCGSDVSTPAPSPVLGSVADTPAMVHAAVDVLGVVDDAAARMPLDVADEADAAALMLESRIVEAPSRRQTRRQTVASSKRPACVVHRMVLFGRFTESGAVGTAHPVLAGRSGAWGTARRDSGRRTAFVRQRPDGPPTVNGERSMRQVPVTPACREWTGVRPLSNTPRRACRRAAPALFVRSFAGFAHGRVADRCPG